MFYTLKSKLILIFSLLLVVPLLTMTVIFTQHSKNNVELISKSSSAQTLEQYAGYLDMLGGQVEDAAFQVLSNQLIQRWIGVRSGTRIEPSQTEQYQLNAEVKEYLSQVTLNLTNIASISLSDRNGFVIGNDSVYHHVKYNNKDWYSYVLEHGPSWVGTHLDPYQPHSLQNIPVNSLIIPLVELNSMTVQGIIKINVESSLIQQPLSKIEMEQWRTVQLINKQGLIMAGNESDSLRSADPFGAQPAGQALLNVLNSPQWSHNLQSEQTKDAFKLKNDDGTSSYWFYRKLDALNWIIIGEITEKELFRQIDQMSRTMLAIGLGLLLLTLAAAYWISASMTRPLSKLSQMMRRLEMGDFHAAEKVSVARRGETGYLLHAFERMAGRLNQLIHDEFTLKLRKQDAEYKALLMQVNPHFLYNTLETIGALAAQQKTEQLLDVTESLGQMLRHSLKLDSDTILLSDELQQIEYYTFIMETRFEDSLFFSIEKDPSLEKATIMKFMLQPLIENAVKYSKEKLRYAHIRIRMQRTSSDFMELSISDNGEGMNEELIKELITVAYSEDPAKVLGSPGSKIGLRNVLVRCRLYYGEAFSVNITSQLQQGTTISLTLPVNEEDSSYVQSNAGR